MHSGAVFSLVVVSYDERRKDKCGRLLEYDEAVLVWGDKTDKPAEPQPLRSERAPTPLERSLLPDTPAPATRKPNHAQHYTRNIRILMQGQPTEVIVKIHPALIIQFNGINTTP